MLDTLEGTRRTNVNWPSQFFYKGPLLLTWFNLISEWIRDHIHYKVFDEITYPFLNFNGAAVEVWEWISNSPCTIWVSDFLSMLGSKLIHI